MSRKDESIYETRMQVYHLAGGRCETCGKPVPMTEGHLAHRIPQRKNFIDRYTEYVIHHPANFKWTCPTDECNNAVSIAGDPKQIDALVMYIVTEIMSEVTARIIRMPHLYRDEFKRIAKIAEGDMP